jgi:hypothetical protein
MLAAPAAILPIFDATGLLLLVLRGGVIPALAIGAFQRDDVSHLNLGTLSVFLPDGNRSG